MRDDASELHPRRRCVPCSAGPPYTLINSEIGKVCIITVCGGSDMKRWLPLIDQIETYAKREGCRRVRIYGRKGWLHVLDGYEEKHVIMDKELG